MRALYKRLGIDTGLTTAYHPQANGQVERKNQEVEAYLRLFIGKRQDDWVDLLPTAEFVINSRLNSATGHTPFELLYGYTPDFTIPAGRPKFYETSALTVGDKVWLQAKQIKIHQQSAKLGPKQLGLFEITKVISDVDYRLALPPALKIHDVFHVDRLSPYKGNDVNG